MVDRTVVLGDVVDSQGIENRERFQRELGDALDAATEASSPVAPFALQKGIDEFAGALASPAPVYRVVRTVTDAVRPRRVRFAVVHGTVDVQPDADDVRRMDGPAFHRADELVAEASRLGVVVRLAVDGSPLARALEDEMNLLLARRLAWTDGQAEAVAAFEEAETQRAVAERLDLAPSTVSEKLAAARASQTLRFEKRLGAGLDTLADRVA